MYFLDSDICINLLRGKLPVTYELMSKSDPKIFGIPAIVEGELRTGAQKSNHPKKNLLLVENFLSPFQRIPFDSECAISYAKIRARLEQKGNVIGPNDLLIAATAKAHGATLVTGNVREFMRVDGLDIEYWEDLNIDER